MGKWKKKKFFKCSFFWRLIRVRRPDGVPSNHVKSRNPRNNFFEKKFAKKMTVGVSEQTCSRLNFLSLPLTPQPSQKQKQKKFIFYFWVELSIANKLLKKKKRKREKESWEVQGPLSSLAEVLLRLTCEEGDGCLGHEDDGDGKVDQPGVGRVDLSLKVTH